MEGGAPRPRIKRPPVLLTSPIIVSPKMSARLKRGRIGAEAKTPDGARLKRVKCAALKNHGRAIPLMRVLTKGIQNGARLRLHRIREVEGMAGRQTWEAGTAPRIAPTPPMIPAETKYARVESPRIRVREIVKISTCAETTSATPPRERH